MTARTHRLLGMAARLRPLRHRLRPARPRAPARALGRGPRRRSAGREGPRDEAVRGGLGGLERACRPSRRELDGRRAGGARVRRRARARRCSARRTRSWRRRSRSLAAGAEVEFVDCNRDDLCMSFADFERKAQAHRPRAAFLVHIGGHIAFDVERIAAFCRSEGIFLIEDCAHAHGASWHGRRPGTWGDAGIWSFARDEDDLDRRGRHARLAARRARSSSRARSATTASPTTPSRA